MVGDHPHRSGLQLRIDLLRHVLILQDSDRSGIKPGRFTARPLDSIPTRACPNAAHLRRDARDRAVLAAYDQAQSSGRGQRRVSVVHEE